MGPSGDKGVQMTMRGMWLFFWTELWPESVIGPGTWPLDPVSGQELLISVPDHELGNLDHSSQGKLEKVYKRVNLWANLSEHRLQKTIRVLSYGDLRVYVNSNTLVQWHMYWKRGNRIKA